MASALNQYIDLYVGNTSLINDGSAPLINDVRPGALSSLETGLLPKKGSENYEVADLESWLSPNFGINIARVPLDVNPAASFSCGVPTLSTSLFMLINDAWAESADARKELPEGVEIGSLRDFALRCPEIVGMYYASLADISNPLVALNSLLVQDGMFLRVKKGVRLERPLQLVNILAFASPLMAVRRLLIIVEDDAEAKLLICDHTQNPDVSLLSLSTTEIFVGRNARFDLCDLEESTESTTRLSSLYLSQKENSDVSLNGMTLYNGTTRNEYFCAFAEPHASLKLYGMGIEDKSRILDTFSHVSHTIGHCKTDELFKYVVDDSAVGDFTGRILVDEGAVKTEAYQSNRNLVGSPEARMFSKPQLEIYNDDVKCSHGTAIGQLDAMQLFYMRTRGLSEEEARLLLKQAFMADVIDGVRIPALRDRLRMIVERRFAGFQTSCADCAVCKPSDPDA
ncbi:MAG: SufD family Fe-S cluster assembly protein [Clostridium sp.]|nr:SufD family Fe-S cluster assembly protein [Clostridium sp.]